MFAVPSHGVAGNWAATRRQVRVSWLLALLAVAALHLLLLLLVQQALQVTSPLPARAQAPLVLVWLKPPDSPPAEATPAARAAPVQRPPERRAQPRAAQRGAAPAPPADEAASLAGATATTPAASAPGSVAAAAASAPGGNLLDTEASRRAIREAARQRPIGETGAQATGEAAPVGAQERLAQEIARGARGDCLKGEYAGSGMGLLSLPFWLMAELREKCRR
jgi:hypothetical protein